MSDSRTIEQDKQLHIFNHLHSMVINYLMNLDIDPMLRQHCFQNMDQAAYWAREGIKHIYEKKEAV